MQRPAGVEDVVDEQQVAALDVAVGREVVDLELARLGAVAVARRRDERELERDRDPTNQIGGEDARALQDRDDGEITSAVGLRHLGGHAVDAAQDLALVEEHPFDVVMHG